MKDALLIAALIHRANVAPWAELTERDEVQRFLGKLRADRAILKMKEVGNQ